MRRPLGQHFLFDNRILKRIVDCAQITPEDTVVEIGPGLGTMTKLLAERAKRVIAIEIDKKLVAKLEATLSMHENVEIVKADALKFPYDSIQGKFKVVANIPYYITTPLIFRLLEFKERIFTMTLLLQKEVAQRIVASPGGKDYGVLSIVIQLWTKPSLKFLVTKEAFSPEPKVDSALVNFEISETPVYDIKDEDFFLKIVKTAFSQRRKTIMNSLKSFKNIKKALLESGIDSGLRPEVLSIKDFIRLADALSGN
ncbi:MAG: ribosomal RNA small subunit methyltransferase A [Nitrospirae bacterium]|nr:ribosomal RNA small subunit methyltransferase A [Nitrospirota bacterium]